MLLYRREPPPAVELSAVSRTEDYEDIEMGHQYEDLSKYSEAYDEIKPSQSGMQQTSGDYEFSQCAAYKVTSAMARSTPVVSGSDDKSGSVVEGEQEPEELGGQDGEQYANIQV